MLAQRAASEGPRWTRAVEDQSAPIPEDIANELGRRYFMKGRVRPGALLARRTRTVKLCSFDARNKGQSGYSLVAEIDDLGGTESV